MSTILVIGLVVAVLLLVFGALALLGRPAQDRGTVPPDDAGAAPRADGPAGQAVAGGSAQALRIRQAQERIAAVAFDPSIVRQVRARYPHLSSYQTDLVLDGLRQWFEICALVDLAPLSMPSAAVDEAWHAFICSTEKYRDFCAMAFGRYLDHQPPDVRSDAPADPDRDARTWVAACAVEGIDPAAPDRLPLLYALDAEVAIPGRTPVDPATMAALVASRPASSGTARTALADGPGAHPAGSALAPTPSQPASDGRLAPAGDGMGLGGGALDWMASWLLWRSLLESAPAPPAPEPWRPADADAAPWHALPGGESGRSDRTERVREVSSPASDGPVLADADETSAEYGASADDSGGDGACGGGDSSCSGGGEA